MCCFVNKLNIIKNKVFDIFLDSIIDKNIGLDK